MNSLLHALLIMVGAMFLKTIVHGWFSHIDTLTCQQPKDCHGSEFSAMQGNFDAKRSTSNTKAF